MWARGRVIPGRAQVVATVVFGPDAFARQAASLAAVVHPASPASRGWVWTGDPGVDGRWAGRTVGPVQNFRGVAAPVMQPMSVRVGADPGLPSTGSGNTVPLAYMSRAQVANRFSFGGY